MLELKRRLPKVEAARSISIYGSAFLVLLLIFSWHLGSQTTGLSPGEAAARSAAKLSQIAQNALFAPYRVTENILFHLSGGKTFFLRLTSILFGMFYFTCFFYVLKGWFGKPIATLSTVLLAATPLFLLAARTATPAITFAAPASVIFAYSYFTKNNHTSSAIIFVLVMAAALYTPGVVWLALVALVSRRRQLMARLGNNSAVFNTALFLLFLILMLPLVYSFVKQPSLVRSWLLIPAAIPAIGVFAKDLAWTFASYFVKLQHHVDLSLSRLPVLDAAQIGLFIFGVYVMWTRLRTDFLWLGGTMILGCVLSALNKNTDILILTLPSVALICGMGLRYLFIEWWRVFPRNPMAKIFAISLMFCLILIHVLFGIRYSLLAWPSSTETKHTYVLK